MDINTMLRGVDCACGKHHSCAIEHVCIERGAIAHLRTLCAPYSRILLVADENTYAAAGKQTEAALGARVAQRVIFDGKTVLIPNETAIARVRAALDGSDLIIGIGSGVIQDLCKYVAHFADLPYMIVATAPSMDGYASTGAAMILGGMKETVSAGVPLAIVADTEVLCRAPMDMICAGYGDIIGKYSALCDWRLAHVVYGEYLCPYIYDTTYAMIERTRDVVEGLLKRDPDSVGTLMEALVIVGIMMSFAGSSRPASGSEHHLSHFFEITGIVHGAPYLPHGIDVAYATVITAALRERLLAAPLPAAQYAQPREQYIAAMDEIYGSVGASCVALQDKLGRYREDRLSVYCAHEAEIRAILAEMPSAREIEGMLLPVALHIEEFYALYGKDKIADAVRYAKDLKDRYTVLWLNYDVNGGAWNE